LVFSEGIPSSFFATRIAKKPFVFGDKGGDGFIPPGKRAQVRIVMGIAQKADIEDQVGVPGQAPAERKRGNENDRSGLVVEGEMPLQRSFQILERHVRGVDQNVGTFAYPVHVFPFPAQAVADGAFVGERMAAAGFLEPASQDFIVAIEKQQRHIHAGTFYQLFQFPQESVGVKIPGADIGADGDRMGKPPVGDQPPDQGHRQVVHRLKA